MVRAQKVPSVRAVHDCPGLARAPDVHISVSAICGKSYERDIADLSGQGPEVMSITVVG